MGDNMKGGCLCRENYNGYLIDVTPIASAFSDEEWEVEVVVKRGDEVVFRGLDGSWCSESEARQAGFEAGRAHIDNGRASQ